MQYPTLANIRALIVFNPAAGQAGTLEGDLQAARDVWRAHGWIVDLQGRPVAPFEGDVPLRPWEICTLQLV